MGNRGRELLELASGPERIGKFESGSSCRNADQYHGDVVQSAARSSIGIQEPGRHDRMGFAMWFLGQALLEFEIPWGLIGPVLESFCDYLNSKSGDPLCVSLPAGLRG